MLRGIGEGRTICPGNPPIAHKFTYKLTLMDVFFTRLKVGWPNPMTAPKDWDGCWRVYTICADNNRYSCTTRADVRNLESTQDQTDARSSYHDLLAKAHTGLVLAALYDETKCHEAHSFLFQTQQHAKRNCPDHEVKIFRIWGTGKIRIYFMYLPNKCIVLLKTWAKRKNKLSNGEELELENMAKKVIECLCAHSFESREI